MATIPRRIYDTCEDMLYQRGSLVKAASERLMSARERAYAAHGQNLDTSCVASSGDKSGPVERAVFAILQAEADLCAALKWAEVFSHLDDIFAGKPEAQVAEAIYMRHVKQKDVAEVMHYDRQSVRRYRDNYVCYCALLAAEKNLIKVQEDENDDSHTEDG